MSPPPRRSNQNNAEGSPRPRIIEAQEKSHQRARNSDHAATSSTAHAHQEPRRRSTASFKSQSAITRATQSA